MREATFLRKKVQVSEKDYKKLLRKFNPEKLTVGGERKSKCPLCKRFLIKLGYCEGCTFYKFNYEGYSGCIDLIKRLLRYKKLVPFLATNSIRADTWDEVIGIQKIQKILLNRFKKVEE